MAKALGYKDASQLGRLLPVQYKSLKTINTPGGPQSMLTINHAGLFRLIGRCRKRMERLRELVFDAILPAVRENGLYIKDDIFKVDRVLI